MFVSYVAFLSIVEPWHIEPGGSVEPFGFAEPFLCTAK